MRARFHAPRSVVTGFGIALAAILAPAGTVASGASSVFASCQPTVTNGYDWAVQSTQSVAQPFMPSTDGSLADVQVAVNLNAFVSPSLMPPLVVSLDTFDPSTGQPGTTLASTAVSATSVPTAYPATPMTTVDFNTSPDLSSGASYAIVLSSSADISSEGGYRWLEAQTVCENPWIENPIGTAYHVANGSSGSFVVDAQPQAQTPEAPYAVILPVAAIGMLGGAVVIRRRQTRRAT
jgi:hypothetical protein